MKKKMLILTMATLIMFLAAIPLLAGLTTSIDTESTWRNAYRFTNNPGDLFLDWCIEMEDLVDNLDFDGDTFTFDNGTR